ncbi:hypothetical protein VOLCADRAFT_97750 [Volvox carteri f. nagariensis]|uniref:Uncharacterized protein n=1 Tax=Volvox carteri f. nagariensis TaxID=3068 RepID=D8UDJ5_VOLCA|nr:uncharacterized protein VOLCADRAFT_97750 [Volvox carteri f. nagariensis]EFJ42177.1 hypothetical protein VOLCADRAFT_97750 [Volvox carteri f. nagariensis]|eukprot:XP_002956720.1 hypothetical protein VOLCADRAFT_97750 [Volvox carteri f. nagariensis]
MAVQFFPLPRRFPAPQLLLLTLLLLAPPPRFMGLWEESRCQPHSPGSKTILHRHVSHGPIISVLMQIRSCGRNPVQLCTSSAAKREASSPAPERRWRRRRMGLVLAAAVSPPGSGGQGGGAAAGAAALAGSTISTSLPGVDKGSLLMRPSFDASLDWASNVTAKGVGGCTLAKDAASPAFMPRRCPKPRRPVGIEEARKLGWKFAPLLHQHSLDWSRLSDPGAWLASAVLVDPVTYTTTDLKTYLGNRHRAQRAKTEKAAAEAAAAAATAAAAASGGSDAQARDSEAAAAKATAAAAEAAAADPYWRIHEAYDTHNFFATRLVRRRYVSAPPQGPAAASPGPAGPHGRETQQHEQQPPQPELAEARSMSDSDHPSGLRHPGGQQRPHPPPQQQQRREPQAGAGRRMMEGAGSGARSQQDQQQHHQHHQQRRRQHQEVEMEVEVEMEELGFEGGEVAPGAGGGGEGGGSSTAAGGRQEEQEGPYWPRFEVLQCFYLLPSYPPAPYPTRNPGSPADDPGPFTAGWEAASEEPTYAYVYTFWFFYPFNGCSNQLMATRFAGRHQAAEYFLCPLGVHEGDCSFEPDPDTGQLRPRVYSGLHSHANSPHTSNLNVYAKVNFKQLLNFDGIYVADRFAAGGPLFVPSAANTRWLPFPQEMGKEGEGVPPEDFRPGGALAWTAYLGNWGVPLTSPNFSITCLTHNLSLAGPCDPRNPPVFILDRLLGGVGARPLDVTWTPVLSPKRVAPELAEPISGPLVRRAAAYSWERELPAPLWDAREPLPGLGGLSLATLARDTSSLACPLAEDVHRTSAWGPAGHYLGNDPRVAHRLRLFVAAATAAIVAAAALSALVVKCMPLILAPHQRPPHHQHHHHGCADQRYGGYGDGRYWHEQYEGSRGRLAAAAGAAPHLPSRVRLSHDGTAAKLLRQGTSTVGPSADPQAAVARFSEDGSGGSGGGAAGTAVPAHRRCSEEQPLLAATASSRSRREGEGADDGADDDDDGDKPRRTAWRGWGSFAFRTAAACPAVKLLPLLAWRGCLAACRCFCGALCYPCRFCLRGKAGADVSGSSSGGGGGPGGGGGSSSSARRRRRRGLGPYLLGCATQPERRLLWLSLGIMAYSLGLIMSVQGLLETLHALRNLLLRGLWAIAGLEGVFVALLAAGGVIELGLMVAAVSLGPKAPLIAAKGSGPANGLPSTAAGAAGSSAAATAAAKVPWRTLALLAAVGYMEVAASLHLLGFGLALWVGVLGASEGCSAAVQGLYRIISFSPDVCLDLSMIGVPGPSSVTSWISSGGLCPPDLYIVYPRGSQKLRAPSPHLTSPHLTSPHLTSPRLTSPHLTSPHFTSPHLTSPLTSPHPSPHLTPHLTSPHLTSPHLTSLRFTSPDPARIQMWRRPDADVQCVAAAAAIGAPPTTTPDMRCYCRYRRTITTTTMAIIINIIIIIISSIISSITSHDIPSQMAMVWLAEARGALGWLAAVLVVVVLWWFWKWVRWGRQLGCCRRPVAPQCRLGVQFVFHDVLREEFVFRCALVLLAE